MGVPQAAAQPARDALEILSVELLDERRTTVAEVRTLAAELKVGLGWHYLLDVAWALQRLEGSPKTVLDAGAGTGIIQWYLADRGWRVVSVDRVSRRNLASRFRARYRVSGLRPVDLAPPLSGLEVTARRVIGVGRRLISLIVAVRHGYRPRAPSAKPAAPRNGPRGSGEVILYDQDLQNLVDIADSSVDEIVSISSLEHNTPENLEVVVAELLRVLRPGGRITATLGASGGEDWYHEPSQGWCYSEATLRRVFQLPDDVTSNYQRYGELLRTLRGNAELRDNLAGLYFKSGNNGMPWGRWDPQYQSVGVCKVKPTA